MSDSATAHGPRPLPARPNLEFERKRAKTLAAELRARDPNAKLADAQFAIAREYGFASWPRLVTYFETLSRHERSAPPPAWYRGDQIDRVVESILLQHRQGNLWRAQMIATFVPRFYGKPATEVLATPITIDDARLVIARQNRLPSWDALVESPGRGDLAESAIMREWTTRSAEARRTTDWLVSRGANLAGTLNRLLLQFSYRGFPAAENSGSVEFMEFLLQRGADPNWMPSNGISVLEHALLRYGHPQAVDELARRVTPKKAFWIAAGLGDALALTQYFDRSGRLTGAARRHRPDFTAVGPGAMPSLPDASDLDIMWEAFYVAALNQRFSSMDALLARGFPVDHAPYSHTILTGAINTLMAPVVEFLLKRGARVDFGGIGAAGLDEWLLRRGPTNADARRIYELCGGRNADDVVRRSRENKKPATFAPTLAELIDTAKEEAARLGQAEVEPHNLFVAFFRTELPLPLDALGTADDGDDDFDRMVRSIAHRLVPRDVSVTPPEVPLSTSAKAALDTARTEAESRNREQVHSYHLLFALAADSAPIAEFVSPFAGTLDKLRDLSASAL